MLPDIPKTKRELLRKLELRMRKHVEEQVPLMTRIRSVAQHEGTTHTYDRFDAPPKTESYQEHLGKLEIQLDEVPTLMNDKLWDKLRRTADELAQSIQQMFYTTIERTTAEVGNVVNGEGQPLSQDHYLEMLDKVLIDFDDQGRPTTAIHAHPNLAAALRTKLEEWNQDPIFRKRAGEIWQRKRLEWRDRESDRKLVD